MKFAALLRGINVGGKNLVPMAALSALATRVGCCQVQTYIQSGNLIFDASAELSEKIPALLTAAMELEFGYRIPVTLRSAEELTQVLARNPLQGDGTTEDMLHVYFLAKKPTSEQLALLDPNRSLPDSFVVHDREIYLRLPNGMARTKLTNAYFDAKLATICTARNWRTLRKLCELTSL